MLFCSIFYSFVSSAEMHDGIFLSPFIGTAGVEAWRKYGEEGIY